MTDDTRPLPPIDELAAARLKANAGRYTVVSYNGEWYRASSTTMDDGRIVTRFMGKDGVTEFETTKTPINAAMVRDNGRDVFEELADAYNILGLLRERLLADGELDDWRRDRIGDLLEDLGRVAAKVRMLRDNLPAEYRRDGYPVQRDEVAS